MRTYGADPGAFIKEVPDLASHHHSRQYPPNIIGSQALTIAETFVSCPSSRGGSVRASQLVVVEFSGPFGAVANLPRVAAIAPAARLLLDFACPTDTAHGFGGGLAPRAAPR